MVFIVGQGDARTFGGIVAIVFYTEDEPDKFARVEKPVAVALRIVDVGQFDVDVGRQHVDVELLGVCFVAKLGGEDEGDVCPVANVVAEFDLEGVHNELALIGWQGLKRGLALRDGQLFRG